MRNILVTGAAGFLGSHLVDELVKDYTNKVVGLDNLSGGYLYNVDKRCVFVEGDIRDTKLINELFKEYHFDYVFHLAAYAAEGLSPFIRHFNYDVNIIGSMNLINASINHNVKCFVFTSSAGVYGDIEGELTEDRECHPQDPYGIAKYAVEMDLQSAYKTHKLPFIIFRPHHIFGERQNINDPYRNVIAIFMRAKREGRKATIFGDGNQTRSFSYVKDIIGIIANSIFQTNFYQQVINIGGEKSISINELANLLLIEKEYVGDRFEVKDVNPSHYRLKKLLKNEYKTTPLKTALIHMWKWMQSVSLEKQKKFEGIEVTKNLPIKWY